MDDSTNEYDNFDTAGVAAEIGESLFPTSGEKPDLPETPETPVVKEAAPVVPEVVVPPADPSGVVSGQNSEARVLPKSWKRDMSPEWEKASPAMKSYIYAREADVMRGIQQYAGGYQNWDTLIKPFAPLLEQNPEVNPVQLMQGLMQTHLQLLDPNGASEHKTALVKALLNEYGISLEPGAGPTPDAALVARLQKAETLLQRMSQESEQSKQIRYNEELAGHEKAITAFAADPKNKYFEEVGNDILRFIKTGTASDLATAYDLACWANPVVRAKMLAEQSAPAPADKARDRKNGRYVNLDGGDPPVSRAAKTGTIDNTIDSIVASHYPKH